MNGKITLASSFSGLQADISQTSPAQLAASVRKSTLDRPFILTILRAAWAVTNRRACFIDLNFRMPRSRTLVVS